MRRVLRLPFGLLSAGETTPDPKRFKTPPIGHEDELCVPRYQVAAYPHILNVNLDSPFERNNFDTTKWPQTT